jgi:hypothetical protein
MEAVIGHMEPEGHLGRCYLKAAKAMRGQRYPHHGPLQPPPRARLAEVTLAPGPHHTATDGGDPNGTRIGLLTGDSFFMATETIKQRINTSDTKSG